MTKPQLLKELLNSGTAPFAIGIYDGISARIAEQMGFQVALMSGYGASASTLGMPDYGLMTMSEMVTIVRNLCKITNMPVIADGDTGYGNPLNVKRTVEEYEQAGAAAIQLEDQLFPKRCGHMQGKEVIPTIEHCKKIEIAVETRKEMLILARSDAKQPYGIDEAIDRVNAYADAGADFVLIDAPDYEDLPRIREKVKAPLMVNMVEGGKTKITTREDLKNMGFNLICYPTLSLFSNIYWTQRNLKHLIEKGTSMDILDEMARFKDWTDLAEMPKLQAIEQRFGIKDFNTMK